MPTQFAVIRRTPKAILRKLNPLILDQAMTISELAEWLASHGVRVSREAVWNYGKALRAANDPRVWLYAVTDRDEQLLELKTIASDLAAPDVALLVALAKRITARNTTAPRTASNDGPREAGSTGL
jgi:hypothetical protein